MKHPLHLDVHRVTGVAGDDRPAARTGETGAAGVAGPVFFHRGDAANRVLDRVIAGATAEVSLEIEGQVLLRLLGEARRRHDHARGAKAALERLGIEKRLLHRMELAVGGQPLERGDLAVLGPERGNQATVDRLAVEPDRARAAIAGVTPFLHAKPAQAPQKGSQALAGTRFGRERFAVDPIVHGRPRSEGVQADSSERICSAK